MTRKDYILIAEVLRIQYLDSKRTYDGLRTALLAEAPSVSLALTQVNTINRVAEDLADSLVRENPRFNNEHFMAVVHGEKGLMSRPIRRAA